MRGALLAALGLACAGCVGTADVLDALADDPATVCIVIGAWPGAVVRIIRTREPNAVVRCWAGTLSIRTRPEAE